VEKWILDPAALTASQHATVSLSARHATRFVPLLFSFLEIFNSSKIAVSNFYPEFVMGCQLDLYKIEFHYYIIVGRLECVYIV
jgi:hypothetical protein